MSMHDANTALARLAAAGLVRAGDTIRLVSDRPTHETYYCGRGRKARRGILAGEWKVGWAAPERDARGGQRIGVRPQGGDPHRGLYFIRVTDKDEIVREAGE